MTGKAGPDPEVPNPDDIVAGVLGELKRHARVMRRMVERAMHPNVPDAPPENTGNKSANDRKSILGDDANEGR